MKTLLLLLVLCGIVGMAERPAWGATKKEQGKTTVQADTNSIETMRAKIEADLNALSSKLDKKLDELQNETSAEAKKMKADLEAQKKQVQQALTDIRHSTSDMWDKTKANTINVIHDIGRSLENVGK